MFTARAPIAALPAICDAGAADPWILLGDGGGDIHAIDQADDVPPSVRQAAVGGPACGPPVLAYGVVYASADPDAGDSHLVALDQADGRVLFDTALPGAARSGVALADARLVVATSSGDVLAYDGPDS
jgi:outer membrane protein assembly factor BamB